MAKSDWIQHAACKGVDTHAFFPEEESAFRDTRAIESCRRCRVQDECLRYALDTGTAAGIWGGLDEHRRNKVLRALRQLSSDRTHPSKYSLAFYSDSGAPTDATSASWVQISVGSQAEQVAYVDLTSDAAELGRTKALPRGTRLRAADLRDWWIVALQGSSSGELTYTQLWEFLTDQGYRLPGEGRKGELRNVYAQATQMDCLEKVRPGVFRLEEVLYSEPPWEYLPLAANQ